MNNEKQVSHVTSGLRKLLEYSFVYNTWQYITGSESAKRRIVREQVQPFYRAKMLDIGCGTGALLDHIDKKLEVDFVGYDINPEYIAFAQKKYGKRARFYCSAVSEAEFNEKDFDIVTAVAIVHHLSDAESSKLIALAAKKVRPGGTFVLSEPVWTDKQSRLEKYLMSKDRGQNIRTQEEYVHLAKEKFAEVKSVTIPGLYFIPWTVCIVKCKTSVTG